MTNLKSNLVGTKDISVFDIFTLPDHPQLIEFGNKIGALYTDKGLPIDMALDRLPRLSKLEKLAVLTGACEHFLKHKRDSGATERSLVRQRKANKKMLDDFIKSGEIGVY